LHEIIEIHQKLKRWGIQNYYFISTYSWYFVRSISKLIQDCLIHVMYLNFFLLKCSACGLAYQLSNVSKSWLWKPQTINFLFFSIFRCISVKNLCTSWDSLYWF
jgi:hypothetical protein